jgi:hypothetical protein
MGEPSHRVLKAGTPGDREVVGPEGEDRTPISGLNEGGDKQAFLLREQRWIRAVAGKIGGRFILTVFWRKVQLFMSSPSDPTSKMAPPEDMVDSTALSRKSESRIVPVVQLEQVWPSIKFLGSGKFINARPKHTVTCMI